jgi:uncharacterized protein
MGSDINIPASETVNEQQDLPAGDFSSWLRHARNALLDGSGTTVACGECVGCCSSSYFIYIKPGEIELLGRVPKEALVAAPGLPKGHLPMGYDKDGQCPMLANGKCSIYEQRPQTCRNYDCRVFTAAGIAAGGDEKAAINQRVRRWKFSYPTERERDEHSAVQAAAKFIREHANCFPGGRVPTDPSRLAILAIKVYDVFLKKDGGAGEPGGAPSDADIANAIVDACRKFDAMTTGLVRSWTPVTLGP